MIVMGLNLGICREEEKQAKKEVILGYLTSHLKVNSLTLVVVMLNVYFAFLNKIRNMPISKIQRKQRSKQIALVLLFVAIRI